MARLILKHKLWVAALILVAGVFMAVTVYAATAPEPTKPGSSLSQRVAQRKKEQKIKLDKRDTTRLEQSCVGAQTKIRQLRDEYVSVIDRRQEIYRKVDAKLWVAIGDLKYIDKDTFKLEQQRAELLRQVNGFEKAGNEFRQTLDDLSTMNCAADVVGFKAMIDTARLYNTQLKTRANGITDQVVNNIKPVLSSHASELRPKASQE